MKRICLIGLGGTIVCSKTDEGLQPKHSVLYLLENLPEINDKANIDTIQLLQRTIVFPDDWINIAKEIVKIWNKYDGFIITMGTDALAYTSSMLSFMIRGANKPIVITGAMIPIDGKGSDVKKNLLDSVLVASEKLSGIYVVFDSKVMFGSRASKIRSNNISAFESINCDYVANIKENEIVYNHKISKPKEELSLDTQINTNIVTIKLNPQTSESIFNSLNDFQGYIIEGYGDGNISDNLLDGIINLIDNKKTVVLASQCTYGPVEHKYKGGHLAIENGAISSKDMTKESILTKLMWCMGKHTSQDKIKELMHTNISGEIINK